MIHVQKTAGGYMARVLSPDGQRVEFETTSPLSLSGLMERLYVAGCHQIDVVDAINQADPLALGNPGGLA